MNGRGCGGRDVVKQPGPMGVANVSLTTPRQGSVPDISHVTMVNLRMSLCIYNIYHVYN